MKHEKTFEAINKLKDIEIELHRLKNALEMANRALDAQRTWIGLDPEEQSEMWDRAEKRQAHQGVPALAALIQEVEAKLKEKNNG